jgi:hypothetical protein
MSRVLRIARWDFCMMVCCLAGVGMCDPGVLNAEEPEAGLGG